MTTFLERFAAVGRGNDVRGLGAAGGGAGIWGGGGGAAGCVGLIFDGGLPFIVQEVQVLCQAENGNQRCNVLSDVLLAELADLLGYGSVDAAGNFVR